MATTPNYSFSVYSSTDTDVRFLDFRVATAGSQSTSNFYVIDTVLKQHSDAIDSINATPSAFVVKGTYSAGSLYTASVANYPGYKNEQLIVLSLNQKNTGAVQININGTTNKDVMKYGSDGVLKAVDAGDFVANSPVLCLYDGTRFVVIGITSASSITVTGEAGDILQIADDGTIESSGKKAAQPNGIATLDENGNVVQVANMANSAAAVYSGTPVSIAYAGAQRIASITAYGETPQGGTVEAPVALTGVDSVQVCGRNLLPNKAITKTVAGITYTVNPDKSVTAKGTASSWGNIVIDADFSLPAGTYTLNSNMQAAGVNLVIGKDTSGTKHIAVSATTSKTFELSAPIKHCVAYIAIAPDSVVDTTIYPMLNLGNTAMPYEPYQGSVTPLPIPRPLHKVGDVRDVCRTRVKSVYDKRIVLDGTESWKVSSVTSGMFFIEREINPGTAAICSNFVFSKSATTEQGKFYIVNNQIRFLTSYETLENWKAFLTAQKEAGTPVTVYYQSTAYDGTNGLDVCLTEYQNGFVELDGTEDVIFDIYGDTQKRIRFDLDSKAIARYELKFSHGNPGDVPTVTGSLSASFNRDMLNRLQIIGIPDTWTALGVTDTATAKTWLAAQKAAGTPVQVVYQLATPESYATDPVDFDNTAGPLTVVTGGQVEVKMTDFVTDRTPAFLNKLDKTGDGSDVTVTFTEATEDADIASSDKLSILFGKILKRFSTITSKFTTVEGDISDIVDGTTTVANATTAATADKVKNKLSLLSGGGQDTIIYDGSTAIAAAMNSSFIGAEPAFIKNSAFNKNFGSSAGTVCQGNDGRLSDARRSSNITMSLSGTNLSISYS